MISIFWEKITDLPILWSWDEKGAVDANEDLEDETPEVEAYTIWRKYARTQTRANCSPKEKNQEYREVQPDLTPDIEVFHMMFEICDTKNIKQHIKYFIFQG